MNHTSTAADALEALATHMRTNPGLPAPSDISSLRHNNPRIQVTPYSYRQWVSSCDSWNAGGTQVGIAHYYVEAAVTIGGTRFDIVTADNHAISRDEFDAATELDVLVKVA